MPLDGDIKTFSVPAIGRMIYNEKKTGVLKISSGEHSASVYFKDGEIVFVSGGLNEDLFLKSLLRTDNLISEEDVAKSLKIAQTTGKRLGLILLEQGYLSKNQLVNLLRFQFKEALAAALSWDEGVFNYTDGLNGYTEDIHLSIDPIRLMAEAQQWKEYRSLIPNDNVVFEIKSTDFKPDILSSDSASRVMLLINGKRNVFQIITETGLTRPAVYRSLADLASQGVITRNTRINGEVDPTPSSHDMIIRFYLNIFNQITADLTVELGRQKTVFLFEKSLKSNPYYNLFFSVFQSANDIKTNLILIQNHILNQKKSILQESLVKGLNIVVFNLLKEEYQLLGFAAFKNTVDRAEMIIDSAPGDQLPLTRTLKNLLNQLCEDKDLLQGYKSLPETAMSDNKRMPGKKQPMPLSPANIETASIIAFYSIVIQTLKNDLQQDIGAKVSDLIQNAFLKSDYYDKFLSQFIIDDSISTNVNRISDYITKRGYKLDKQNMVHAFHQVIFAVLQAENQLLGSKAVRMSLLKIEEQIASENRQNFKVLADLFFTAFKNAVFQ